MRKMISEIVRIQLGTNTQRMSKPVVVRFDDRQITWTGVNDIDAVVSNQLCSYCTLDYKYISTEKEDKTLVCVTAITKFIYPEHKCQDGKRPLYGKTKYIKVKD